jgi:hypothetical protein
MRWVVLGQREQRAIFPDDRIYASDYVALASAHAQRHLEYVEQLNEIGARRCAPYFFFL